MSPVANCVRQIAVYAGDADGGVKSDYIHINVRPKMKCRLN